MLSMFTSNKERCMKLEGKQLLTSTGKMACAAPDILMVLP